MYRVGAPHCTLPPHWKGLTAVGALLSVSMSDGCTPYLKLSYNGVHDVVVLVTYAGGGGIFTGGALINTNGHIWGLTLITCVWWSAENEGSSLSPS